MAIKKDGLIHDTLTGYDFKIDKRLTPTKAIRQKCLECQCGNRGEVDSCTISDCTLWPLRNARASRESTAFVRAIPKNGFKVGHSTRKIKSA